MDEGRSRQRQRKSFKEAVSLVPALPDRRYGARPRKCPRVSACSSLLCKLSEGLHLHA